MNHPQVTVLMPVYNAEGFVEGAIESILNQSFADFEFLIINDGSTDSTPDIITRYALHDSRIIIEHNPGNLQIAETLNRGLRLAKSPLIARMDADDISLPDRLAKQLDYMERHKDVVVCGSAVSIIGKPDEVWLPPLTDDAIRAKLFFESCLYHPTVIYRRDIILRELGGYGPDTVPAEDFDLWMRLSAIPAVQFANLPDVLLRYRYSTNSHNVAYKAKQKTTADRVRKDYLHMAGIDATDAEMKAHDFLVSFPENPSPVELWGCKRWMTKLYFGVANSGICNPAIFHKELMWRWQRLVGRSQHNPLVIGVYLASEFGDWRVLLSKIAGRFKR